MDGMPQFMAQKACAAPIVFLRVFPPKCVVGVLVLFFGFFFVINRPFVGRTWGGVAG